MTRVDLHPEDLFDHLRRGELREDERERLERHCAVCSACAFELQVVQGDAYESEPTADDHAMAARALERMLSSDAADRVAPVQETAGGQLWLRAAALVLAGVLVGGSVSAAALASSSTNGWVTWIGGWVAWIAPTKKPDTNATPSPPQPTRARRVAAVTEVQASLAKAEAPPTAALEVHELASPDPSASNAAASITASSTVVGQSERRARVATSTPPSSTTESIASPTTVAEPAVEPAAWLFRAASRARSEGRVHEAAALYGALQRDYAGSEVEVVTRVALGRLALAQLNDPHRALSAFDSYLDARPDGALAEEARGGRVSALQKLGRNAEAQAAAQELLNHHPHTLYGNMENAGP